MTPDQEKTWKAISKRDLVIGPHAQDILDSTVVENNSIPLNEMLADLQEKLDSDYTVVQVNTVIDPKTFDPVAKITLRRTKPYSEEMKTEKK